MKKIRQWMNRMSIKKKIVFYGYVTIAPILILICVLLVSNNYQKIEQERLQQESAIVNTLAENWQMMQSEIKAFSSYICINQDIGKLLTTAQVMAKNKNARLWMDEAPMEIILDMIALKGFVETLAIYPENGIYPYLRGIDGSVNVSLTEELKQTQLYQDAKGNKNAFVWKYVPKGKCENYLMNNSDKLVFYREIRDLTQKKTLGHLTIGANISHFSELSKNVVGENEAIVVTDPYGGVLYTEGTVEEKLYEYLQSEDFLNVNYKERTETFTYGAYDVLCIQLGKNSSIVCKVVPQYSFFDQLKDAAYMPLIMLLSIMVGMLPLLAIISNMVTAPLLRLRNAIVKVSTGDFEQEVEISAQDEIGEVAACFNNMVCAIQELIEKNYASTLREKESELAALQAQINPHFLYNTLDSLYWQAVEADNEEIAESIIALSQLFRLVLGQGKSEVTVGHEMELVSKYLQIQKMRFTKRLKYSVEVDRDIQKAKIPKLILQPFVENAIVHGFENMDVPCRLNVTGKLENGKICFVIRDTGVGMRQDQLDSIWEDEPDQYRKQRIGRYAIKNICERLERKYQDRYSLDIQSQLGKGTVVTLMIPYEEE